MLYHRDIYLPRNVLLEVYEYFYMPLTVSNHALDAARTDIYGPFRIPRKLNFLLGQVIEVEVVDDEVSKVVIRCSNNEDVSLDICIVVALPSLVVKTAWQNEIADNHKSLKLDKYVQKPNEDAAWAVLKAAREMYPPNPKYDEQAGRDV